MSKTTTPENSVIDPNNSEPKAPGQEEYEAGIEFLKNNDLSQAANAFHNALLEFKEANDRRGCANASDKLADVCIAKEEYSRALDHLNRAFSICSEEGDELSLTLLRKKRAFALFKTGQHEKALEAYLDLIDAYRDFNNPAGTVDALEKIAEIYITMEAREKAADALKTAAAIHRNFKHQRQAEKFLERAEELLRPPAE